MRRVGRGKLGVHDAWIATAFHHDAEPWAQDDDLEAIPDLTVVRL